MLSTTKFMSRAFTLEYQKFVLKIESLKEELEGNILSNLKIVFTFASENRRRRDKLLTSTNRMQTVQKNHPNTEQVKKETGGQNKTVITSQTNLGLAFSFLQVQSMRANSVCGPVWGGGVREDATADDSPGEVKINKSGRPARVHRSDCRNNHFSAYSPIIRNIA